MPKLKLRHRGKRGVRVVNGVKGFRLALHPGQEKEFEVEDRYADMLRARSQNGDDVEVVGDVAPAVQPDPPPVQPPPVEPPVQSDPPPSEAEPMLNWDKVRPKRREAPQEG